MTKIEELRAALLEYVRESTPKPAGYGDYPSVTRKHNVNCEIDANEIMHIVVKHFPEVCMLEVTYQAGFFGCTPAWVIVDRDTRLILKRFPIKGRAQSSKMAAKKKAEAERDRMMQAGGAR